jgi:cytochrome oxidase Cu insertion factor (SCO1/SenC/PrrC family)
LFFDHEDSDHDANAGANASADADVKASTKTTNDTDTQTVENRDDYTVDHSSYIYYFDQNHQFIRLFRDKEPIETMIGYIQNHRNKQK